jgi:hypothetical protein
VSGVESTETMHETVQLLSVVVASPSDVTAEREAVESVTAELNRTVAADRKILLQIVRWETDAYPGFHLDGPQGICDKVLQIEDCDVIVGIFWTRFGKPTPSGMTGTEHEINKAVTSWQKRNSPQIMVFFNNAAPSLRSSAERRQWALVAEYREKFPAEGLFWEYEGASQFGQEFRKCMANYLRGRFSPVSSDEVVSPAQSLEVGAGGSPSNQDWTKLLIDNRIPVAQIPNILTALAEFMRACGSAGIEAKLTAELVKRTGEENG